MTKVMFRVLGIMAIAGACQQVMAESTQTDGTRVNPASGGAPTEIPQDCQQVQDRFFGPTASHKEIYECFSQKNLTQCPLVRKWGTRGTASRGAVGQIQYEKKILQKKIADFMPLLPEIAGHPQCFPQLEHLQNNLCFFSSNIDQFYLKKYKPSGPEYIVLTSLELKDYEMVRGTHKIGEGSFPGVSGMLIVKKGKEPYSAGNHAMGEINFVHQKVNLSKATVVRGQAEYRGQQIADVDSGIETTSLGFKELGQPQTTCGGYSSLSSLLKNALSKAGSEYSLDKQNEAQRQVLAEAVGTGLTKGGINLANSAKSSLESMQAIGQIANNSEVPDPEGTVPCKEPKNIAAAAAIGGMCSGMRDLMRRSFGEAFEAVAQECYKLNCTGESAGSERRCLEFNANNPQFQGRMSACYAGKVAKKMGTDAWNHVVDCVTKGADRFSQCAADVAVAGALTIAGTGAFKAISGISAASKNAIIAAAAAGKLSKNSARLLLASQQIAKSGSMFTADLLLNQFPTDFEDLLQVQVNLKKLLASPRLPDDIKALAQERLARVTQTIAEKSGKVSKEDASKLASDVKAAEAGVSDAKRVVSQQNPKTGDMYLGFRDNVPDEQMRRQIMERNAKLSDQARKKAIEAQMGQKLTPAQWERLRAIHEVACPKGDCTGTEIRDLKSLAEVQRMFPGKSPERIKDLYRMKLLGKDSASSSEFARLQKLPFEPKNKGQPIMSEAEQRATDLAQLRNQRAEVQTALEKLNTTPGSSPLKKAELAEQLADLSKQEERLEIASHAVQNRSDFQKLMDQPFKPKDEQALPKSAEPPAKDRDLEVEPPAKAVEAASPTSPPLRREEFEQLLQQEFSPKGSRPDRAEAAQASYRQAQPQNPVAASYRMPNTGEVISGQVIGMAKDETYEAVRFRYRDRDGDYHVTHLAMRDLIPEGSKRPLSDSEEWTEEKYIRDLAREAVSTREEFAAIRRERSAAFKSGDMTTFNRLVEEEEKMRRKLQPLSRAERRNIQVMEAEFASQGLSQRLPMKVDRTGQLLGTEFSKDEVQDFAKIRRSIRDRILTPQSEADVALFKKVEALDPVQLRRSRAKERLKAVQNQMIQFTNSRSYSEYYTVEKKMKSRDWTEAYRAAGEGYGVREAFETINRVIKKPGSVLESEDAQALVKSLRTLRSNRAESRVVEQNPELREFLDYVANRAAEADLIHIVEGWD